MDITLSVVLQALIVACITAVATGYVNGKVMESKLRDLKERITRIEHYLNGLLIGSKLK
jgi:hypothetical protein